MAKEEKRGFLQRLASRWGRSGDKKPESKEATSATGSDSSEEGPNLSQAQLVETVLPMLGGKKKRFQKVRQIHARQAEDGEKIVSITSDGPETENVAKAGDMVVRNLTGAGEMYIISAKSFPRLYDQVEELDEGWALYNPKGEVLAIEVTDKVANKLGVNAEFFIEAPWGSDERVRVGDFLVAPLPALKKIYRIARVEFEQTYSPI